MEFHVPAPVATDMPLAAVATAVSATLLQFNQMEMEHYEELQFILNLPSNGSYWQAQHRQMEMEMERSDASYWQAQDQQIEMEMEFHVPAPVATDRNLPRTAKSKPFSEGDTVLYSQTDGTQINAEILKIHNDLEHCVTILLDSDENGGQKERQTTLNRIKHANFSSGCVLRLLRANLQDCLLHAQFVADAEAKLLELDSRLAVNPDLYNNPSLQQLPAPVPNRTCGANNSLQVFVDLGSGRSITLDVMPGATVAAIKATLQEQEGLNPHQYSLVHAGKHLDDQKTVKDYCIQKEATLTVMFRLRGGMHLGIRQDLGTSSGSEEEEQQEDPPSLGIRPDPDTDSDSDEEWNGVYIQQMDRGPIASLSISNMKCEFRMICTFACTNACCCFDFNRMEPRAVWAKRLAICRHLEAEDALPNMCLSPMPRGPVVSEREAEHMLDQFRQAVQEEANTMSSARPSSSRMSQTNSRTSSGPEPIVQQPIGPHDTWSELNVLLLRESAGKLSLADSNALRATVDSSAGEHGYCAHLVRSVRLNWYNGARQVLHYQAQDVQLTAHQHDNILELPQPLATLSNDELAHQFSQALVAAGAPVNFAQEYIPAQVQNLFINSFTMSPAEFHDLAIPTGNPATCIAMRAINVLRFEHPMTNRAALNSEDRCGSPPSSSTGSGSSTSSSSSSSTGTSSGTGSSSGTMDYANSKMIVYGQLILVGDVSAGTHAQGVGSFTCVDSSSRFYGATYVGAFRGTAMHGHGALSFPPTATEPYPASYCGDWVNNVESGNGKATKGNGEKYVGQYLNGVRDGYGTIYYPNGNVWSGEHTHGIPVANDGSDSEGSNSNSNENSDSKGNRHRNSDQLDEQEHGDPEQEQEDQPEEEEQDEVNIDGYSKKKLLAKQQLLQVELDSLCLANCPLLCGNEDSDAVAVRCETCAMDICSVCAQKWFHPPTGYIPKCAYCRSTVDARMHRNNVRACKIKVQEIRRDLVEIGYQLQEEEEEQQEQEQEHENENENENDLPHLIPGDSSDEEEDEGNSNSDRPTALYRSRLFQLCLQTNEYTHADWCGVHSSQQEAWCAADVPANLQEPQTSPYFTIDPATQVRIPHTGPVALGALDVDKIIAKVDLPGFFNSIGVTAATQVEIGFTPIRMATKFVNGYMLAAKYGGYSILVPKNMKLRLVHAMRNENIHLNPHVESDAQAPGMWSTNTNTFARRQRKMFASGAQVARAFQAAQAAGSFPVIVVGIGMKMPVEVFVQTVLPHLLPGHEAHIDVGTNIVVNDRCKEVLNVAHHNPNYLPVLYTEPAGRTDNFPTTHHSHGGLHAHHPGARVGGVVVFPVYGPLGGSHGGLRYNRNHKSNKYQDTANRQVMTSMYAVTVYNGGMKHPAHATYGLPGFHRRLGRYKKGLLALKTQREQAAVYREGLGTTSHVTRVEYCFKGALAKMFEPGGLVDNLQQMNWADHTQLLVGQNRNGISVTMVEAASK